MKTATVNVKYVNPPKGKGPASIKDGNNTYFKFWTRTFPLETFQVGGTYTVGYSESPYGDRVDYMIEEVQNVTGEQVMAAPKHPAPSIAPKSNGNGDHKEEQIYVAMVIGRAIEKGDVDPYSADDQARAGAAARAAHARIWSVNGA